MFWAFILSAHAVEIQAPMSCLGVKPRMGDVFTFSETCDAKRVPIGEAQISGARTAKGSGATAGAKTTIYTLTKGNESFELRVLSSITPADLRAGNLGPAAECTHKVSFRLEDPFAKDGVTRASELQKGEAQR